MSWVVCHDDGRPCGFRTVLRSLHDIDLYPPGNGYVQLSGEPRPHAARYQFSGFNGTGKMGPGVLFLNTFLHVLITGPKHF